MAIGLGSMSPALGAGAPCSPKTSVAAYEIVALIVTVVPPLSGPELVLRPLTVGVR